MSALRTAFEGKELGGGMNEHKLSTEKNEYKCDQTGQGLYPENSSADRECAKDAGNDYAKEKENFDFITVCTEE